MERARKAMKWDKRSEHVKLVFMLGIVIGATLGGYGLFMVAMGTTSPLVVVTSESMVPTLEKGDMLVLQAKPPDQIFVGDIIVFQDTEWHTDGPVVHRVISVTVENGTYSYETKGDANTHQDPDNRRYDEVIGVVIFRVPFIGHVSLFLRTTEGIIFMVILFVVILVLPEFVCKDDETTSEEEGDPPSPEVVVSDSGQS
ncbi:MAG: signal peptidase I [Candidatus Thorarchaeota archaeon]|nr:MAG: signal peptidase I [Candidatus Thorarchaeota archaeon]